MEQIFDLFGDPVPRNHGGRGRPEHIPTQENINRVTLLLALGWSNERIANAVRVTLPTLRKHYNFLIKRRAEMRDRMKAAMALHLWQGVKDGRVAAIREFQAFVDRNDRMEVEREMGETPASDAPPAPKPAGKKIIDQQLAIDADADLMAELEKEANAAVH